MAVKFFGQYLIEQGEIDAGQLCEALDLMEAENRQMGEIAVQQGFLTQTDADWINVQQRTTDKFFGDLALELNMLTQQQLGEVVMIQQETRLFIGEALVELESIEVDRLPGLLDQFRVDQAPYESSGATLPAELEGNLLAQLTRDLFPKFCMRMARLNVKTGSGEPLSKLRSYEFNVGLQVHGPPSLSITLVGDRGFCVDLAAGVSGMESTSLSDDLIADGVGEFLNVLAGNAIAVLERDGIVTRLDPPTRNREISRGIAFELVVGNGCACLILAAL